MAFWRGELIKVVARLDKLQPLEAFALAPTSANLRALLTDETGTGAAVFASSPTLITPSLGAATATSLTVTGGRLTLGVDGASGQVPFLALAKRASGTSETIGPSDGAGGYRGLFGYGSTDFWYMRIGDTTTDDFQFTPNGIALFGGQIVFPATANPSAGANTFDDYEELTWTPGISFGGGTTGITYGARVAAYVKLARQVIAPFDITLTAKGTSTGAAKLTGLPLTSLNDGMIGSLSISFYANFTGLTGALTGYVDLNATTGQFVQNAAASTANLTDVAFTNTTRVVGVAIYRAT